MALQLTLESPQLTLDIGGKPIEFLVDTDASNQFSTDYSSGKLNCNYSYRITITITITELVITLQVQANLITRVVKLWVYQGKPKNGHS